MNEDSKELSSMQTRVTALITPMAADLIQVIVTHTTGTSKWQVYDGEDANGDLKLDMKTEYSRSFSFPGGMYMRRGIYFVRESGVHSALFRWRNRPSKEG